MSENTFFFLLLLPRHVPLECDASMRPNNLASFGSIQGAFDACFGQMGHLHFGTGQALSVVQEALPTSDARRRWRWPTCPHATASPCSPEFNPAKITCQKYLLDSQKKCSFWFPFEQELAHETLKASRRFQRRPQRIVSTIYCWGHQNQGPLVSL